jgi:putative ABC transport system permease protein
VLLVLISCGIAAPIAYFYMNDWLKTYDYKIDIGFGVFVLVMILAIVITLLTVSYQAIRAALMNPVKSLKTE